MRWIVWPLGAVLAVAGLVLVIGWMLPVEHQASRSGYVGRSSEQVYATIADVAGYADWLEGVSRIEMLSGPGEPIRFREHTSNGAIVMEVVEAHPSSRFVTRIADPGQPFGGTWTFEIAPERSGSRVTITERGEVYNPIFRFMARFVFGYTKTMETFLASLQRKLD